MPRKRSARYAARISSAALIRTGLLAVSTALQTNRTIVLGPTVSTTGHAHQHFSRWTSAALQTNDPAPHPVAGSQSSIA